MPELPDWLRAFALLGKHGTEYVVVAVDASGQMYSLVRGADGAGTLRTILTDGSGRLIMVPRGESGYYLAVDASGFLTAVMKGLDGATLRSVAVDASGQIVMVPRGQSGVYLDVDASGYLTSVMKGLEGTTLRTVAVDAAGNLVAVMQGDYEGALRTVKLDDAGRMSAFIVDSSDVWGEIVEVGNAELAARLGSPVTFDRRGQVITTDDFRNGYGGWEVASAGTGGAVALNPVYTWIGGYSVKLTAGSDSTHSASVHRYLNRVAVEQYGIAISFSHPGPVDEMRVRLYLYDAVKRHDAELTYDIAGDKLRYLNSSGVDTDLATGIVTYDNAKRFDSMKLVADFSTDKYVRALFNGVEYDMSALACKTSDSALNPCLHVQVTWTGQDGQNGIAYLDYVIITGAEPT